MLRVAIVGGGASGMMSAYQLAKSGCDVTVFEKETRVLKKLAATGNGRCNFTNASMDGSHYTGGTGSIVQKVLDAFDERAAQDTFLALGMPSKALESGMIYPHSMRAKTVEMTLLHACTKAGVKIETEVEVARIESQGNQKRTVTLHFDARKAQTFDAVVLATGGSFGISKGAKSNGHKLAKHLGHAITQTHPGIVALEIEDHAFCKRLSGIKVYVGLTVREGAHVKSYEDDLLFTDTGISGIATLKASNHCLDLLQDGKSCHLEIDFYPELDESGFEEMIRSIASQNPSLKIGAMLESMLPEKIAKSIGQKAHVNRGTHIADLDQRAIEAVTKATKAWPLRAIGARKGDNGQVTCGGVDFESVNADTLESKIVPGVYFTGEILNVQGECGGYNLHWAWASAHVVSEAIAARVAGK